MTRNRTKFLIICLIPAFLFLGVVKGWDSWKNFAIVLEPQKTGITTLHFHDASRNRPLITEVWYPVESQAPSKPSQGFWIRCEEARDAPLRPSKEKYPLILMSHGNGGDRFNQAWLAEILASNGYIVASIDHYGNTWNNKIPECYAQPWERPQDISFVLNELLTSSPYKDAIDSEKIGFSGYSLGGATGMWIAGGTIQERSPEEIEQFCIQQMPGIVTEKVISQVDFSKAHNNYQDPRIGAVFVLAPALGSLFDEKSLQSINIPVYIIAAAKDRITPLEKNAKFFAKKLSKATLKVLNNDSDHYVFLSRASLIGRRVLQSCYCEDPVSVNRKEIHEDVAKAAVHFFNENLR